VEAYDPGPGAVATARRPPSRRRGALGLPSAAILGLLALTVFGVPPTGSAAGVLRLAASGTVLDDVAERPISGVRVVSEAGAATSGPDGAFTLDRVGLLEALRFEADGYLPARVSAFPPRELRVALTPRTFGLTVRDADTGRPVQAAAIVTDPARAQPLDTGVFRIGPATSSTSVTLKAPGYGDATVAYAGQADVDVRLQPRVAGTVVDARTGQPVPRAFVAFDGSSTVAGRDGTFELPSRPSGPVRVLAPGYRRADATIGADRTLAVQLEPQTVKALYLTIYGIGDRGLRGHVLELAEKTEVNALVVDVKGDRGWMAYHSDVPLADKIGANDEHTISDVGELLRSLKQRGIYTIARIVVMKDDKLARNGAAAGLDVAIKDARTGRPWIDGEDLGWVDPFRSEVWDYNIALAREAAEKGFDEVQFDYIRFPTDAGRGTTVGAATYSKELTEENRVAAITEFLRRARDEVRTAGAFLGVDVFGYVTLNSGDIGIGQHLESLADAVDYIHPMVYPSAYSAGLPGSIGYPQVVARPYDVIYESMKRARERTEGRGAVMRPWLQYFDDYPWETRKAYNAPEINAQRKAAADAGSVGWMMWDPSNKYARGGLDPKR
jgi:hypothetical protein